MTRHEKMKRQFEAFDKEHPNVWVRFIDFTFDRIELGYEHYSADAVAHRVRWETNEGDVSRRTGFKINNNHVAFYARKFSKAFPSHRNFLRKRVQTSKLH
jgi:hypothetical protein